MRSVDELGLPVNLAMNQSIGGWKAATRRLSLLLAVLSFTIFAATMIGLLMSDSDVPSLDRVLTRGSGRYLAAHDELHDELKLIPKPCREILLVDRVTRDTGPSCLKECQHGWTWLPKVRPSVMGVGFYLKRSPFAICAKANVFSWFSWTQWPQTISSFLPPVYYVGALMYLLLGLLAQRRQDDGWKTLAFDETPGSAANPPRAETEPTPLDFPLSCVEVSSHAEREHVKLYMAGFFAGLDRITDVSSTLGFLSTGQPIFAAGTCGSVIITGDPLQVKGVAALRRSIEQGYPTKGWLEEQYKEGIYEGRVSLLINVYAFLGIPALYVHGWFELGLRVFSIGPAMAVSIPAATEAEMLLIASQEGAVSLNDFYKVQDLRRQLSFGKYADASVCASWLLQATVAQFIGKSNIGTTICFILLNTLGGTKNRAYARMFSNLLVFMSALVQVISVCTGKYGFVFHGLYTQMFHGDYLQRVSVFFQISMAGFGAAAAVPQFFCIRQQYNTLNALCGGPVLCDVLKEYFCAVIWVFPLAVVLLIGPDLLFFLLNHKDATL